MTWFQNICRSSGKYLTTLISASSELIVNMPDKKIGQRKYAMKSEEENSWRAIRF